MFVLVQVILFVELTCQFSPPLGDVTVIVGILLIVNTVSLSSLILVLAVSLTLILHCIDGVFGIIQL